MRITNNMMSHNYLRSLNSSLEKQNKLQEQLSDGKTIHRPSDDPVKAVRSLRFATSLNKNEQFSQNLSDAQSWMENTDGVMSDMSSIMIKAEELVVSADDTKTASDIHTIGAQIDGLINQVVALGNTRVGDRYLFAGQSDSTQPFERKTIRDPNSNMTKEIVVYNGDTSLISMPIQEGAVNSSRDSVNLTGTSIFGSTSTIYGQQTLDVLNHLLEIKNEMTKTSSVSQTNQNGGIGLVGGKYTGEGFKSYDIRVDGVDQLGRVLGASFSTDGGNTWTAVGGKGTGSTLDTTTNPPKATFEDGVTFSISDSMKVSRSNVSGGTAAVIRSAATVTNYKLQIDSVDASGKVLTASYSTDGGSTWTSFSDTNTATAVANLDSTTNSQSTALTLPNGRVINIPIDSDNVTGNTYDIDMANMDITQSNTLGGTATVSGSTGSYTIRIDTLGTGGQVATASYSVDGTTWVSFNAATEIDTTDASKTSFTLPNGRVIDIATDTKNAATDTYRVDFNSTGVTLSQSNTVGGKASVVDNTGYKVMVDTVAASTATNAGQILTAKYSSDGVHWDTIAVNTASSSQSTITLPDGTVFNMQTSIHNVIGDVYSVAPQTAQGDVYSFRVPQDAFRVEKTNSQGGEASIAGTLTDMSQGTASVRIDSIDTNGNVTEASYSTDGGSSWTALSNYKVSQTNTSGPATTVTGSWGGGSHTVKIDSVNADGKVLTVSIDGGMPTAVTNYGVKSDENNNEYSVANITFGLGQVLTIPTDKLNKQGDIFTITQETDPVLEFNASSTDVHLSNGITMNIVGNAANKLNDKYAFTLPQGTGPDTKWLSSVATKYINDDHNMQLKAQTVLGARMSMYEMASNMMANEHTVIEDDLGTNEGLDMAQAITDYNTIQNVYRAALAVGGKIMQTSVVDFLK